MRDKAKAPIDAADPFGIENFLFQHVRYLFLKRLTIPAAGELRHQATFGSTKMTSNCFASSKKTAFHRLYGSHTPGCQPY
jgi:hypothetical protein